MRKRRRIHSVLVLMLLSLLVSLIAYSSTLVYTSYQAYAASLNTQPDREPSFVLPPPHARPAPHPREMASPTLARSARTPLTTRSGTSAILLLHGFNGKSGSTGNGNSSGYDCSVSWGDMVNYIRSSHDVGTWSKAAEIQTIGFYRGDTNCSVNLHSAQYATHCSNYYPENTNASQDGTNNESLYHLSCLLDWYIYLNYGRYAGSNIEIVAHSMGGLIVRNALYQVQRGGVSWAPPTLGGISDIVDFSTPHRGVPGLAGLTGFFACGSCKQFNDLVSGKTFINEMQANAQNPQASGGTDWTLIGSNCDAYVDMQNATDMVAVHHVAYVNDNNDGTCYDHSGPLRDTNDAYDAAYYYCNSCTTIPPQQGYDVYSWSYWNKAPRSLHEMMYGLWYSTW